MKVKLTNGTTVKATIKKATAEESARWGFLKMAHWNDDNGMACSVPVTKTQDGYVEVVTISRAASLMGRKGGKSKSDAKASAARENGRKGGRPVERKTYWILSGEGDRGTWKRHITTPRGASMRATKERCGGDRWAQIWEEIPETHTVRAHIRRVGYSDTRDIPTIE